MAPKESETSSAVFSYLSQQNRPYSANDLHLNLHKEHGKTAIQKVVDTMVEEGKLKVKVNGKQTCYFVNQDLLPTCSDEDLAALDSQTKQVEEEVREGKEALKKVQSKLLQLGSSLTLQQAAEQLAEVTKETITLRERLSKLEGNTQVTSAEEKLAIQGAHTKTVTAWRKRKRMASDILDSILESWPKSKASLFEDIGVDSDEAVGVKIPK